MGKFVDVEVVVTSTVIYRLPRPTKAEVVEALGDDSWDKDDPESSIQEYFESEGIEELIKGHRPLRVDVDEMEISCLDPAPKGAKAEQVRPYFKLKCQLRDAEGAWHDAWFIHSHWQRVGLEFYGEVRNSEELQSLATGFKKFDVKRLREGRRWDEDPSIKDVELIPFVLPR